jgi:hypothetical protein
MEAAAGERPPDVTLQGFPDTIHGFNDNNCGGGLTINDFRIDDWKPGTGFREESLAGEMLTRR